MIFVHCPRREIPAGDFSACGGTSGMLRPAEVLGVETETLCLTPVKKSVTLYMDKYIYGGDNMTPFMNAAHGILVVAITRPIWIQVK